MEEHFDKKVLLKLSSTFKLRNFDIGMDKAISSHTLLFYQLSQGIQLVFIDIMKSERELFVYETPQMSVVELVLEQAVLSASDLTITNPDMGWGD